MNTTQIGDISEQRFILYCLQHEIPVCRPIGNNLPYDFIIDFQGKLLKIQVKTAYPKPNSITDVWTFNTRSCSKNYTEVTNHNYVDLIDYFAVVRQDREEIIFISIDKAAKGSMNICYEDCSKPNQNHYKDFILF